MKKKDLKDFWIPKIAILLNNLTNMKLLSQ